MRVSRSVAILSAVITLCIVAAAGSRVLLGRAIPASVRIERRALVVFDNRGRELWRKAFDWLEGIGPAADQRVWIGDLGGDGQTDVLFVPNLRNGEGTYLICYAADGRERWRFAPGREVSTARETFAPPFRVIRFLVAKLGRNRALRIALTSQHHTYYPDQVALLSSDGRLLREYWHPGYLEQILAVDLTHSGTNQLVLAGVNNARRQATLVVLDPDQFTGAAVENDPAYQFQEFPPGVEVARLVFPPSCLHTGLKMYNWVSWVLPDQEGLMAAVVESPRATKSAVYYHLGADLRFLRLGISDTFVQEHAGLYTLGEIDHPFSASEEKALRAIRYLGHDGNPINFDIAAYKWGAHSCAPIPNLPSSCNAR